MGVVQASTTGDKEIKIMPKKKRLRRQKLEVEFLRQEVARMEGELTRLQEITLVQCEAEHEAQAIFSAMKTGTAAPVAIVAPKYRLIAPRKRARQFVWKSIAERQFKERWRAQNENRNLRAQLETEYELGRRMLETLQKPKLPQVVSHLDRFVVPLKTTDTNDKTVFATQVFQAETILIEMAHEVQEKPFSDPNSGSFIRTAVEKRSSGDAFVMQSNVALPFAPKVAESALWDVLSSDKVKEYCYDRRVVRRSDDMVQQSFGVRYTGDSIDGDFRCRYTLCRFKDGGRAVIVWIGLLEPSRLNGIRCHGIRCQQTGWMELREDSVRGGKGSCTLARSRSRMTMETDDDPQDKKKLQYLFHHAQPALEKLSSLCSSMLEDTLVQEDWKVNGWAEDVVGKTTSVC